MKRNFGRAGRLDISAISPPPAHDYAGRGTILAGAFSIVVCLVGIAFLLGAVMALAQKIAGH